ncbi:hypothetical protein SAMN05428989_1947 [Pseudoxanthomonas sp. GM95]|uniref:hypothetical protein n=1 Tax=Pseudoxanthomonas sp. GM95 TaxID=1881043 RepID=UPI0008B23B50|nr:hypothetical protein [Pseudoxanthomonas sp. GM95]SEL56826.1 hypothetical protein SAMN05428989_1947 [Pseudoxanthomonas sp. GM95]
MHYIEDQPETTGDAALISRLSLWIGQFDPAGKIFQMFEREKCGHNAELMAVLTSPRCSRNLFHAYSNALTRADQLGYFPFNLDSEHGVELTEHDYIRREDRERNADVPAR